MRQAAGRHRAELAALCLALAWLLHLQLGAAQSQACSMKQLHLESAISGPPHNCGLQLSSGGVCNLPFGYCRSNDIMVMNVTCENGQFRWNRPYTFCPQWSFCRWEFPFTLICDGENQPGLTENGGMPEFYDPRITSVIFRNIPNLSKVGGALELSNVQTLDLSNNQITEITITGLAGATNLVSLNLSYNRITELPQAFVPLYAPLRLLDVRHNPVLAREKIDPFALPSVFSHCRLQSEYQPAADDSTLLMDDDMCVVRPVRGKDAKGRAVVCQRVQCKPGVPPVPNFTCPLNPSIVLPTLKICDGIADCLPHGEDEEERRCLAEIVEASIDVDPTSSCGIILGLLDRTYEVRAGSANLKLLQERLAIQRFPALSIIANLENFTHAHKTIGSNASGDFSQITTNLTWQDKIMRVQLFYKLNPEKTLTNVSEYFCDFAVEVDLPTLIFSTTTSMTPVGGSSLGSQAAASQTGLIVGLVVGLVVLAISVLLVALGFQRRRLQQRAKIMDTSAPPTDVSLINDTRERFNLQYSSMLGGADTCQRIYESYMIEPQHVELTGEVLGAGNFGAVEVAYWRAPRQHRGWQVVSGGALVASAGTKMAEFVGGKSLDDSQQAPLVAVKLLRRDHDAELLRSFLLEARLLCNVEHRHILRVVGILERRQPLMLVTEYCRGGNLRDYLRLRATEADSPAALWLQLEMGRQVAAAVAFLHSVVCLHRDLAARNVLVVEKNAGLGLTAPVTLKLADLGLARVMTQSSMDYYRATTEGAVPLRWACPLAVKTRVYTAKSDVYSFGVLLWEIFSGGAQPYSSLMTSEVLAAVEAGQRLPQPSQSTPETIVQLVRDCTQMAVAQRPSMQTVFERLQAMQAGARKPGRLDASANFQASGVSGQAVVHPGAVGSWLAPNAAFDRTTDRHHGRTLAVGDDDDADESAL